MNLTFDIFRRLLTWWERRLPAVPDGLLVTRWRLRIYLNGMCIVVLLLIFTLLGFSGPQDGYYQVANSVNLGCVLLVFGGFVCRKCAVKAALTGLLVIGQVFTMAEMFYTSLYAGEEGVSLLIANMMLLLIVLFASIAGYLKVYPYVFAFSSVATYVACAWLADVSAMYSFIGICASTFILMAVLGTYLLHELNRLKVKVRIQLESQLDLVVWFTGRNGELQQYMTLGKEHGMSAEQASRLAEVFTERKGVEARQNLERNVRHWYEQSQIDYVSLEQRLEVLSPSELSIARLILQGYKLKEICEMLGKSESNVCCQRSRIRAKLGVPKEEDLRVALLKKAKSRGGGE